MKPHRKAASPSITDKSKLLFSGMSDLSKMFLSSK